MYVETVGLEELLGQGGALGPQWEDQLSQGLLAGGILGHRQGHGALPSLPAIPVEMQVGRVR